MITHLAETSVLTRLNLPAVRAAIQPFLDTDAVARCVLSDLEFGFSASNAREWDAGEALMGSFAPVEVGSATINRAKAIQRLLAARALKGSKIPDLIIAAAAEIAGLTVLHYDRDFELIASVTGQRHEWIVPRGTVD